MKNQNKLFLEIILIFLSIAAASLIWKYIEFPFTETDIIGQYSENSFNHYNDLFRYLFFILFPLFIFLVFNFYFDKNIFIDFFDNLFNQREKAGKNFSILILLIPLLVLVLEFCSINFPLYNLDIYHEGQLLSSAFKHNLDKSLWSGSYITVGIIYETISSNIAWNFFDNISIGSERFIRIFYILVAKCLITFLAYQISNISALKKNFKIIFFIILFLIFNQFIDYEISSVHMLGYREIPIIISLILFINLIQNNKIIIIYLILLGALSAISMFWGIDRGIVYNLILFSIFLFLILKKDYILSIYLLFFTIFFWITFWFLLGEEFNYFIINSLRIVGEINYIHGIIHPIPFSDDPNSSRATKTLILILLSIFLSLKMFFTKNSKINYNLKLILLSISLISFFTYIHAVGRSDGPHIKSVFGFSLIFFSILVFFNVLFFLQNFKLFIKIKKKYPINMLVTIFFSIIIFNLINIDYKNILSFNKRLNNYVELQDREFIDEKTYDFVLKSKEIFNDQNCIQLFTNDSALLYLLKKKNCTKYYFVWSVGSEDLQNKFIIELKNVEFIITGSKSQYNSPSEKLLIVSNYLKENYILYDKIHNWKILKKK